MSTLESALLESALLALCLLQIASWHIASLRAKRRTGSSALGCGPASTRGILLLATWLAARLVWMAEDGSLAALIQELAR